MNLIPPQKKWIDRMMNMLKDNQRLTVLMPFRPAGMNTVKKAIAERVRKLSVKCECGKHE